jgi:sec-independent protein translocase protein TatC
MAASDIGNVRAGQDTMPGNAPDAEEEVTGGTMSLVEHLEELRKRMIIALIGVGLGSVIGFIFWHPVLQFLLTPLPTVSKSLLSGEGGRRLVQGEVGEAFFVALQIAIAVGVVIASPLILYQIWAFISPALSRRERKYALPFTLLGVGLFAAGLAVGFVVLRYPVEWLIGFGGQDFVLLLDAGKYLTFVAYFLLAFGLVFELPLVLTFMGVVGIINSRLLREKRMYILFGLWFLSCFITPGADPYSPVIIGACFTVLFELTIILMRIIGR